MDIKDKEFDESFKKDVLRRLGDLEAHIINLIVPIQNMRKDITDNPNVKTMIEKLSTPVKLNDQRLIDVVKDFEKNLTKMLGNLSKKLSDTGLEHMVSYIEGALREIGKRLRSIEEKNSTNIRVYMDDQEMVPGDNTKYTPKKKKKKKYK
jgi:hypothetical protein